MVHITEPRIWNVGHDSQSLSRILLSDSGVVFKIGHDLCVLELPDSFVIVSLLIRCCLTKEFNISSLHNVITETEIEHNFQFVCVCVCVCVTFPARLRALRVSLTTCKSSLDVLSPL